MWNSSSAADELGAGDQVGPYRLEALLGAGGMGVVYRATREGGGDTVALKVLRGELSDDETFRRRFAHEARSAEEVRHPNLVRVLEAGEDGGRHYLAVEYVPGATLEERIKESGPLPLPEVVRVATEVGAALDALHALELVHRDVKVSNVLVRDDGAYLLTDFGLAKGRAYTVLTRPGQVMGTLDYLAPELIRGEVATAASDVYALGCTLYECLTGATPFGNKGVLQVGIAHLEEQPPDPRGARPDCPPAFADALLQALEKDAARRPAPASAYAGALAAAAAPAPS
jgi:serine/threonine-protein kinase